MENSQTEAPKTCCPECVTKLSGTQQLFKGDLSDALLGVNKRGQMVKFDQKDPNKVVIIPQNEVIGNLYN